MRVPGVPGTSQLRLCQMAPVTAVAEVVMEGSQDELVRTCSQL